MEKFRIGVVGLKRGCAFFDLYDKVFKETEVVLCDNDPEWIEELKTLREVRPETNIYYDYDEMLAKEKLDAVVLADYFYNHANYAIKAMEKGIAVLSETTAAPSLGLCVDLVETAERTNAKYMLAANCLYIPGVHAMKKYCESGELGKLQSGNAEYWHCPNIKENTTYENTTYGNPMHWRNFLPPCYYNMHTLGPLMYVTNTVPVKVSGKAVYNPEFCAASDTKKDTTGVMVITEMDNGAIFNTTGCNFSTHSTKWFRLAFEEGALETPKFSDDKSLIVAKTDLSTLSTTKQTFESAGVVKEGEYNKDEMAKTGHGGIDYFVAYYFIEYLKGKYVPYLDVYRSVALSATGILAWYSCLTDSREYRIPDFRNKEDRDKVRGDYRTPFGETEEEITLPYRLDEKDKFEGFEF